MVYNGILMATIGISVMVSIGLLLIFIGVSTLKIVKLLGPVKIMEHIKTLIIIIPYGE